jgi:hypothetical protein
MSRGAFLLILLTGFASAQAEDIARPNTLTPQYDSAGLAALAAETLPPETEIIDRLISRQPGEATPSTARVEPFVIEAPSEPSPFLSPSKRSDSKPPMTGFKADRGPFKLDVTTKITTAPAPSMVPPIDPRLASDPAGEVKGRVDYEGESWQLYGARGLGVTAGPATPTIQGNVTVGTYYKLPPSLYGGKLGAAVETASPTDRKARVEYRRSLWVKETDGFLSVERGIAPPNPTPEQPQPATTFKSGFNVKF